MLGQTNRVLSMAGSMAGFVTGGRFILGRFVAVAITIGTGNLSAAPGWAGKGRNAKPAFEVGGGKSIFFKGGLRTARFFE